MELNFSPEIIAGLKRAGNSTLVSDEMFSKLLRSSKTALTQTSELSTVPDTFASSSKGDIAKEAHCALAHLLIEAVRLDLPSESLHFFLEAEVKWPKSRCKELCGAYSNASLETQAMLSTLGCHPPHVVDIHWCLNHNIKSSANVSSSGPLLAIQLDAEGSSSSQVQNQVKFVCTLPELQDLLSKLKEALRQIEHIAQINHD